jgi:hypothetical protein
MANAIGAVSGNTKSAVVMAARPAKSAESMEGVGPEKRADGDRDDGNVRKANATAVRPTVNAQGQALGQILNAKA